MIKYERQAKRVIQEEVAKAGAKVTFEESGRGSSHKFYYVRIGEHWAKQTFSVSGREGHVHEVRRDVIRLIQCLKGRITKHSETN